MIIFLASHIPHMASITTPLHELMKADVHFEWGPSAKNALNQINNSLKPKGGLNDPSTNL